MKETEVVSTKWLENMAFEFEINGHKLIIDAKEDVGGQDRGPRPKPLMLAALGGCTSMDVVSILKKMRVELKSLNVNVEGELSEEHPKRFTKMHVIYEMEGDNLPMEKLKKAVSLSEDRYCGVSAVYKEVMEITSEIRIKG
ncbi:MAG: OsmC family peroxiredoxin [Bacteroidales bacterium]|nr:OsmC family peroxiredoxin [Bacteroidales bacterium]